MHAKQKRAKAEKTIKPIIPKPPPHLFSPNLKYLLIFFDNIIITLPFVHRLFFVCSSCGLVLSEKGVDFNLRNLKEEDMEQLVEALSDLEVDIKGGKGKINIYTE